MGGNIAQNGYMTVKKMQNDNKNSINFPEWRKSEYFTFKRSFSNFGSHKLSQIRPKFEETTKQSAPESYFIHNCSQDKLLQTTFSVFSFAYWISLISRITAVSKFLCVYIFVGETAKLSLFVIFSIFFRIFCFAAVRKEQISTKIEVKSYDSCLNMVCLFNIVVALAEDMVQLLLKF